MKLSDKLSKKLEKVKAVSIAIDLGEKMGRRLRVEAAFEGVSPQDQLRKMIGLSFKKPQRPRITLSLREKDYVLLAKRYEIKLDNKNDIKKRVVQEISKILHNQA